LFGPELCRESNSGGGRGTAFGFPCRRALRTEGSQKMLRMRHFVRFPAARQLRSSGFPEDRSVTTLPSLGYAKTNPSERYFLLSYRKNFSEKKFSVHENYRDTISIILEFFIYFAMISQ
jgi:hypothetical protein